MKDSRKLSTTGSGETYFITIPIKMIRALKWRKGQKVVFELKKDSVILRDWNEKQDFGL